MNKYSKISLALIAAVGIGAAAVGVAGPGGWGGCQGPGSGYGSGHGPGMMGPRGGAQMGPGAGMRQPGAFVQQRLEQVEQQLNLTAEQQPLWDALKTAIGERIAAHQAQRAQMQSAMTTGNPAQRMQSRIALMEQRIGEMKAMQQQVEAFYASLTEEQKAVVDGALARGPMGGHGPRGRGAF